MKQRSISWILFVLGVAVIARVLFISSVSEVGIFPDSLSYYYTGRLHVERGHVFDPWRAPVYPFILMLVSRQYGLPDPIMGTIFNSIIANVLLLNHVAGVIGIGLFTLLLFKLVGRTPITIILSIFFAINPFAIAFERMMLTESFALFLCLVLLWIIYFLFKRIRFYLVILLSLWSVLAILLRPAFLLFPFLSAISLVWLYRSKLSIVAASIVCVISMSAIGMYVYGNYTYFHYPSITRVQDINLLGNILRFQLPIPKHLETNPWGKAILLYRQDSQALLQPWRLLEFEKTLYLDEHLNMLPAFIRQVIISSPLLYAKGVILLMPEALTDWGSETIFPLLRPLSKSHPIHLYMRIIGVLLLCRTIFMLLLPVVFFLRLPIKKYSAFVLFCILIGGSTILLTISVSYGEYGRLLSIVDPFSLLFIALISRYLKVNILFQRLSRKVNSWIAGEAVRA